MFLFALCFEPQLFENALSFGCHQDGNFLRENRALLSPPRTETANEPQLWSYFWERCPATGVEKGNVVLGKRKDPILPSDGQGCLSK